MKKQARDLKPANLRDSLNQHLHLYALAASAAGVSMMALVQSAEAEIIYTPANVVIGVNQHYDLDITGDGTVNFTIHNHGHATTSGFWASLFVAHPGGNQIAAHLARNGTSQAYALRSGARINRKDEHFAERRVIMAYSNFFLTATFRGGSWISSVGTAARYLGLKFKIDGQLHYGWARLNVQTYQTHITATLTGFAYETIPDKPIKAGQEQEGEGNVGQAEPAAQPQPSQGQATLGALAKGAKGLGFWRRQQDQSLVKEGK